MKKTLYLCLCALLLTAFATNKASAQYTVSGHSEYQDSMCTGTFFNIYVSAYTSGLTMTTYFGDGTASTATVYNGAPPYAMYHHFYPAAGVYTVKCVLNSGGTPIDSMTFSYNYAYCQYLGFIAYIDNNSNCTYDFGVDNWLYTPASFEVDSAGVPVDTVSYLFEFGYKATAPYGTIYAFRLLSAPPGLTLSCPMSGIIYDTVISPDSMEHTKGMAFSCVTTTAFDLAVYGDFKASLGIGRSETFVTNSNCSGSAATLQIIHSPKYSLYSLFGVPYTEAGNVITINIPSVSALSAFPAYAYWSPVGTLSIGDTIHTTYIVTPTTGDSDPSNNTLLVIDTIRASWDPNHKTVSPAGNILSGTRLEYSISFENTGNDTAHNIHIMDTLSNNLDFNTFKLLTSTAPVTFIKTTDGTHNVIKFDFANINLLDSTHHGKCDGMVSFSINAKAGLTPGTKIDNKAGIYFDINPVVMTNNVENTIVSTLHSAVVSSSTVEIYPNPVSTELTIKADNSNYSSASVTNMLGQVVLTQSLSGAQNKVNVKALPAGLYYITLKGDNGVKVQKFEKL